MGFGAIIASGDNNELLPEDLMCCATEVRVEQFLDEPTRFAIRFQEDLEDGEPHVMQAPELQREQIITIAVEQDGALVCLVRGPITERKSSITLGGPGSWYEIRGIDRRVEMSRVCYQRCWEGRASEVVSQIFGLYGFEPDVQETTRVYEESTGTLNQRATDQDFVKSLARRNNLCFWISATAEVDFTGSALTVEETAHFTPSPPRPEGGISTEVPDVSLVPNTDVVMRVNVTKEKCQNVTGFELNENAELPTSFNGAAIDDRSVEAQTTSAQDDQPPLVDGGESLPSIAIAERTLCLTIAGNQEELQIRSESALTEAGWFVTASASTTAHMLQGVLQPHDVIQVEGLGTRDSGAYQVSAVTHTINAADHHQEVQLRRNSVGAAS
jgi:phage protein D